MLDLAFHACTRLNSQAGVVPREERRDACSEQTQVIPDCFTGPQSSREADPSQTDS
jgi:hypothetical protein